MNEQWTNLKGRYRAGREAKKWIQEINLGATATWFLPELLNAEPAKLLMSDVRVDTFHMSRSWDWRHLWPPAALFSISSLSAFLLFTWSKNNLSPTRRQVASWWWWQQASSQWLQCRWHSPHSSTPCSCSSKQTFKGLISEDNWKMKNSGQLLRSCWYRCWCVIARVQNDGDGKSKNKNPKESCSATENLRWLKHFDWLLIMFWLVITL